MFDFKKAAEEIRDTFKDKRKAQMISTGDEMTTPTEDSDFVVMPEWFKSIAGVKGLPFGYAIMIAGNTDSGKTSCAIQAIKAAQEQKIAVILVDTEKKTTKQRLINWGVNPDNLARVQPQYLEEAYDGIDRWIDKIKEDDESTKILVIFDSLGNTPSIKEMELGVEETLQLGLAAKINKRGARRLVPRLHRDNISILIINQTYDNMTSPGKSNAGGNAWDFYCALIFQTSRKKWLEKLVKGVTLRKGARVVYKLYKNHLITEDLSLLKSAEIDITSEGMKLVGSSDE